MKKDDDLLQALSRANPWPEQAVRQVASSEMSLELERRITRSDVPNATRSSLPPRRPRLRWVAAAFALIILGSGIAYAVTRETPSQSITVGCYLTADLDADVAVIATGSDPIAACADLWSAGELDPSAQTVPALESCVLPSGSVGVFPAGPEDPCGALGLAPAASSLDIERFAALKEAIVAEIQTRSCYLPDEAIGVIEDLLQDGGFGLWHVKQGAFTSERPCAELAFDEENRTVMLVPGVPRR